jgi:hypothetical protein
MSTRREKKHLDNGRHRHSKPLLEMLEIEKNQVQESEKATPLLEYGWK